jgi:hypothetical protein
MHQETTTLLFNNTFNNFANAACPSSTSNNMTQDDEAVVSAVISEPSDGLHKDDEEAVLVTTAVIESAVTMDDAPDSDPAADVAHVCAASASTEPAPAAEAAVSPEPAPAADASSASAEPAPASDATTSAEPAPAPEASSALAAPALPEELLAVMQLQSEVLASQVRALQAGQRMHAALLVPTASTSTSNSTSTSTSEDLFGSAPLVNPTRDEAALCQLVDEQGGLGSRASVSDFVELCGRTTSTLRRATLLAVISLHKRTRTNANALRTHCYPPPPSSSPPRRGRSRFPEITDIRARAITRHIYPLLSRLRSLSLFLLAPVGVPRC